MTEISNIAQAVKDLLIHIGLFYYQFTSNKQQKTSSQWDESIAIPGNSKIEINVNLINHPGKGPQGHEISA